LGGTLTNFKVVSKSIEKLNNLMSLLMSDEIKKYAKKEQVVMNKTMQRLEKFLGGIRTLRGLPHALFVTDPVVEFNAVMEARKLKIPVVALANVNANPDLIDFIIPVNTNSSRAV
jgi:small subunit ribosomal protein S2